MSGKAIAIVGARGMGKTTVVKKFVEQAHPQARLIYDPNGEYKELYPHPLLKFDEFTEKSTKVQNALVVYEEATIFLDARGNNMDIKELLVRGRHTNNTMIFVFHSLRAVPRYLFDLLDAIILLKTSDIPDLVQKKFESEQFLKIFMELKNAPMLKGEGIDPRTGKQREYSPYKIYEINA